MSSSNTHCLSPFKQSLSVNLELAGGRESGDCPASSYSTGVAGICGSPFFMWMLKMKFSC